MVTALGDLLGNTLECDRLLWRRMADDRPDNERGAETLQAQPSSGRPCIGLGIGGRRNPQFPRLCRGGSKSLTYPGVEAPRSIAATRLTAKRTKGIASMDGLKADAGDRGVVMQALPPSKEVKLIVPIHDVETFLGGGGQPS
jgi:hypothetical protein